MTTLTVSLPPLHAGQREVAQHPARFKVLSCGRRWGKTRLGTALCHTDHEPNQRATARQPNPCPEIKHQTDRGTQKAFHKAILQTEKDRH